MLMRRFGNPKLVVTILSPQDFQSGERMVRAGGPFLDGYLAGKFQPSLYFDNFSLVTFMNLSWHMKQDRTSRRAYSSLDFDRDGGRATRHGLPNVDISRWNYVFHYSMMDDGQYKALDRMAGELKSMAFPWCASFHPRAELEGPGRTLSRPKSTARESLKS